MLKSMLDQFILERISSRVVLINQDFEQYKEYVANLNTSNNENDLYYALRTAGIKKASLSCDCIYTNVNEVRQNLYLKLISIINNLQTILSTVENSDSVNKDASQSMLIFNLKGNRIALND